MTTTSPSGATAASPSSSRLSIAPPNRRKAGGWGSAARRFSCVAGLLLAACAATPSDNEATREVVLQYLGGDFGTTGPFGKERKQELQVLDDKSRTEALALLDRGAVGFLIYEPGTSTATRVVLVQSRRIVGDFRAPAKASTAPTAAPGT